MIECPQSLLFVFSVSEAKLFIDALCCCCEIFFTGSEGIVGVVGVLGGGEGVGAVLGATGLGVVEDIVFVPSLLLLLLSSPSREEVSAL